MGPMNAEQGQCLRLFRQVIDFLKNALNNVLFKVLIYVRHTNHFCPTNRQHDRLAS